MATVSEALAIGLSHHQAGQLEEAERTYRRIVEVQPDYAEAWHLLGAVAYQMGKGDVAASYIRQALQLKPDLAEAHSNLGNVFKDQGNLDEAIACYRRALELDPYFAEARSNLGIAFQRQGKLREAVTWHLRALELRPQSPQTHFNLGTAYRAEGKLDDAAMCYRRALELRPDYIDAYLNLGNVFRDQRKLSDAVACYSRVLELKPGYAEAHNNLGNALKDRGELDDAVACYRRAMELKPNFAEAHSNLGNALKDQAKLAEALASYRRAVELKPDFAEAHSNLLYLLYFCPNYSAAAIYEEHRRWNRQHAAPLAKFIEPHVNDPSPDRRLRVGYVSPDFRDHSQAFFTIPLLASHDHQKFEIFCYSDVLCPDGISERMRSMADGWRTIVGLSNEQVAQVIREDQIDILVDLSMHMARGRPLLFARKPAPVQVCWLAYPGTTGLSTIDYRLTDAWLDPPGLDDACYSEDSIRLPGAFWCYDPLTSEPGVGPLPALKNGCVTFGSLNNFCKVNAAVLKLWARVLRAVDYSQLLLLCPPGSQLQTTLDFLRGEGIAAERIKFVTSRPRPDYLALYHEIDIALDTFPANGHTTSLDALWMGIPVVTIVGQTAIGRGGSSLLQNLGLSELIAKTPDEYVRIAGGLASNLGRMVDLRQALRRQMVCSSLMDAPRFARNIESAYQRMWERWCSEKTRAR